MITKEVLHRTQVKTVYSSERQERMKVYFQLTEEVKACLEPCKLQPSPIQDQCKQECEKIYDKYVDILKPRYEENKERIDMEVQNSPIFKVRRRKDREGFFFDIADISFREFLGLEPNVKP